MSRNIAIWRNTTTTNRILRFIYRKFRHAPDNQAYRPFGLAIGAILEVHIGNLDPTTDKNVGPTAYI